MNIFKLKNQNGKFSYGGTCPMYGRNGKIWTGKGPLKNHIRLVNSTTLENVTVEEYKLVLVSSTPVSEFLNPTTDGLLQE